MVHIMARADTQAMDIPRMIDFDINGYMCKIPTIYCRDFFIVNISLLLAYCPHVKGYYVFAWGILFSVIVSVSCISKINCNLLLLGVL